MLLTLDPLDPRPRTRQIVQGIEALIGQGALAAGAQLPSTRHLAEQLGLHRATVATAYQTLWSLGWVDLRPGALPRVRTRTALAPEPASRDAAGEFDWAARLLNAAPEPRARAVPPAEPGQISFAPLGVDPRLMPLEPFERSLRAALRRHGARLMEYGDPQGFPPLRQSLSRRLAQLGIRAGAEEILITHGAQQALDLVLGGLARPGDAVVVESPTYDQMLDLLAFKGLRPLALPLGRNGLDPAALEALLARERPALLYTMPSFQNPTGRSLSQEARETLLELCGRHGVPILEDGFEEEMKYFGRPVLPIKSMDRAGLVLYAGTFSKVLFPGLRVGWLAAPRPCVEALTALRRTGELCPAPLQQAALEDFLEKGHYDQHLARLHRRFRRRMETALKALRREIDPALARWEVPTGGYLLWLELPRKVPEALLDAHFREHGVKVQTGGRFFAEAAPPTCLRLSISGLDEAEIDTGIHRLGLALRTLPIPLS